MTEEKQTMRELYKEHGYDPESLAHPRNVQAGDIVDGTVAVVDTVIRNPDPDAPATTRDVLEYDVGPDDVYDPSDVKEVSDGAVSYPEETSVTAAVHWAYQGGHMAFVSIGYGDEMYGSDSEMQDPHSFDRFRSHVWGLSDDFIRFKFPEE